MALQYAAEWLYPASVDVVSGPSPMALQYVSEWIDQEVILEVVLTNDGSFMD
jgi:hypothetical protein